ncbi:hypothetical protein [Tautonia plasticadhaerens]|uniref:Uncharacterized protein n=1 Tax=Tautonia plasticadhaerens TaxID=2527974 RepID=A0A518H280_9BACT|nr:hypothetical protein [Tautonia plasticadhaerens]QDV34956.1 hypothetical protein ElP_28530 [Tautonia plasticadhaerens]
MLSISNIHHDNGTFRVVRNGLDFVIVVSSEGHGQAKRATFTAESEAPIDKAIALRKAMDEADRLAAKKA